MSPVDLIRNYVHEHFEGEATQLRVYEEHWLPLERSLKESEAGSTKNVKEACEGTFEAAIGALSDGDDAEAEGGLWMAFTR